MSQSKLVNYIKLSPHCTKPRQGRIKGISIHTMAGPGSVEGCGQVFQQRKASSHYGIGPDGRIGQYVLEENRAWCTSHKVDHEVVTIEVSSIQSYKEPYECTKKAYVALINLCVDICKRNGIKKLIWKEGKQYCPAFTGNWAVCNMVPHRYTRPDKSCPGNYLFSKYGEIAAEVNKRLQATTKPVEEVEEDMDIALDEFYKELKELNKNLYLGREDYSVEGEDRCIVYIDAPIVHRVSGFGKLVTDFYTFNTNVHSRLSDESLKELEEVGFIYISYVDDNKPSNRLLSLLKMDKNKRISIV